MSVRARKRGRDPCCLLQSQAPKVNQNGALFPHLRSESDNIIASLKEVVEAVLDLDLHKPEEIAEAVGTTAAEIQNRKKKLRRRLREYGFGYQPQEEGRKL